MADEYLRHMLMLPYGRAAPLLPLCTVRRRPTKLRFPWDR
jgi:hypothetical protein